MAVSLVKCSQCGRVFDPVAEHCLHNRNTNAYTCADCLGQAPPPRSRSVFPAPASPAASPKKPRSRTGSTLRIIFGILFILAAFNSINDGDNVWFTCFVIGAGLLIWQFWPQIRQLLRKKQTEVQVQREAEAHAAREAHRQKICSHCGAVGAGTVCEYCGMPFDE